MAAVTVEMTGKLKFEIIPQPAVTAHLASSNHPPFQSLDDTIHGYKYARDKEVKDAVHMWLCMQTIENLGTWHHKD
jgi:hypothetical protein